MHESDQSDGHTHIEPWYLRGPKPSLRMWIFTQMSLGAIYAACVFFGTIAIILIIRALAGLLPENPYAMLETGIETGRIALRALA